MSISMPLYLKHAHAKSLYKQASRLKQLADPLERVVNPIYEIEDYLEDRVLKEAAVHEYTLCDGPKCQNADAKPSIIKGLRYYCLDFTDKQKDFCSSCVELPGQGIDHGPTHRLLQLPATECAVCHDFDGLKLQPGGSLKGPYREYSASGATSSVSGRAEAVAYAREEKEVTIRLRVPWLSGLEVALLPKSFSAEQYFEIDGKMYRDVDNERSDENREKVLQVGPSIEWSHQMEPSPLTSPDKKFEPHNIARVLPNSGSEAALSLARAWLRNCREQHPACKASTDAHRPTRVLCLGDADATSVYLQESDTQDFEYAALSYRWGPASPGILTRKSNYEAHKKDGIAVEYLPSTIRDAVYATRQLGLQHLWVDRLCIIQDSVEDWAREAALMCAVYSGAAVTLSANGSSSAEDGLT
ncbi:hypothetical protein CPLU01_13310 [Colletotrichum plurivorum]|uniref:Heterokaryon incompatibility domain-containing protein n=1 Tax=Colletotrichum plurivorum TaxID=2175906 RepID=A0A8H6N315_9PEZI|nr:hypothetical protein CPLU01_13310 [Colletotrichum plurivorum]